MPSGISKDLAVFLVRPFVSPCHYVVPLMPVPTVVKCLWCPIFPWIEDFTAVAHWPSAPLWITETGEHIVVLQITSHHDSYAAYRPAFKLELGHFPVNKVRPFVTHPAYTPISCIRFIWSL